ncbi:MAG: hypothetical protein PHC95_09045 [Parabacteroides sp.]|nr:hypothetical protein [Parabacteroides sp.]
MKKKDFIGMVPFAGDGIGWTYSLTCISSPIALLIDSHFAKYQVPIPPSFPYTRKNGWNKVFQKEHVFSSWVKKK